jgi:hypothetical protein
MIWKIESNLLIFPLLISQRKVFIKEYNKMKANFSFFFLLGLELKAYTLS